MATESFSKETSDSSFGVYVIFIVCLAIHIFCEKISPSFLFNLKINRTLDSHCSLRLGERNGEACLHYSQFSIFLNACLQKQGVWLCFGCETVSRQESGRRLPSKSRSRGRLGSVSSMRVSRLGLTGVFFLKV